MSRPNIVLSNLASFFLSQARLKKHDAEPHPLGQFEIVKRSFINWTMPKVVQKDPRQYILSFKSVPENKFQQYLFTKEIVSQKYHMQFDLLFRIKSCKVWIPLALFST